jgi:hypothetical protein
MSEDIIYEGAYKDPKLRNDVLNSYIFFLKTKRNEYLKSSDKFLISDYPIDNEQLQFYIKYRVYLRDIGSEINILTFESRYFFKMMSFEEFCLENT